VQAVKPVEAAGALLVAEGAAALLAVEGAAVVLLVVVPAGGT